jgi:hypothetical protein
VDPGGRPGPLFFGCTVCQSGSGAGAEVEAEATGARAGAGAEARANLEAFVDPGGRPRPLFFGCSACQPRAGAGAEVEAEATGARARAGAGVEARVEVEVGAGRGCVVRSWKWVGRLLYASFAASFLFFLSGHSGDQDMCLPAQGIRLNFVRSSLPRQSIAMCPRAAQIPHQRVFWHIFATCLYKKHLKHWVINTLW